MKLSNLIKLKVGQTFKYKNIPAEILSTSYTDEIVWEFKNGEVYRSKSFIMYFKLDNNSRIVLNSSFPSPENLNLTNYE